MRCVAYCLICFSLSTSLAFGEEANTQGLEVQLTSIRETLLVGELSNDMHLVLINNGTVPVFVEPGFLDIHLEIEVKGEWVYCHPPFIVTPGVRQDLQWHRIDPGAQMGLPIGHYMCRKDTNSSVD